MLPAEIFSESRLPPNEAMDAVEVAIARVLTKALRMSVSVTISENMRITAYPETGEPVILSLDDIDRKLRRHLLHQIELELQRRRTLNEADLLRELRGVTAPGLISRMTADGALFVALEIADCYRRLILAGICPERFQPLHERGRYILGSVKEFYITSVVPVMVDRKSTKVRILLNRTSKQLPRLLLQERSRISGIQCLKRIPGSSSIILTPKRIPKDVINSVGKELEEHLHVSILKTHR